MFFEDDELSGRRLYTRYKPGRKPVLKINMRFDAWDKMTRRAITGIVLTPFIIVFLIAAGWYSWSLARKVLFTGNRMFEIKNIVIDVGVRAVVTEDIIRQHSGIEKGMNIFDVPVRKICSDFQNNMSNIKEIEIRRRLPDTIMIRVTERTPVARLGRTGVFVVDSEGVVFRGGADIAKLPVIHGHQGLALRPGSRVEGMVLAAVQVLEACRDPAFEAIDIKSIDVSGREDIVLWLSGGKANRLAWEKMGTKSREAETDLTKRLAKLSQVLQSDEGKRKRSFDSTYPDDVYAE